jgi:cytochrome bd ubiquinol oxidase subunit I
VFAVCSMSTPDCEDVKSITVPALLSFLANGDFDSEVRGVQDLVAEYRDRYGEFYPVDERLGELSGQPIDYVPNLPVTYWGFRLMIGFGAVGAAVGVAVWWLTRRGRVPRSRWFPRVALAAIATPFLGNSFGWIFTEMGRQPFVVAPNPSGVDGVWMFTAQAVSGLTVGEVLTSLIALTLVYGVLAVVEVVLIRRYVRGGVAAVMPPTSKTKDDDVLSFAY